MVMYITSDLHFGLSRQGDRATRALAKTLEMRASRGDILILAGDLTVDDDTLLACLDLFSGFPGKKLAIPGNHDVWVEHGGDSWARFEGLSRIMREAGFHPLEDEPIVHDGIGIVGTMGWYDYSFQDDLEIPLKVYRNKTYLEGGQTIAWGDACHVRWGFSDEEVTTYLVEKLEGHLRLVGEAREIIAILHHLPTKRLLFHPRWLVPKQWRFFNAFLGSERFGQLLLTIPKLRHVICGHVHSSRTASIRGVQFRSIGSSYDAKHLLTLERGSCKERLFTGRS